MRDDKSAAKDARAAILKLAEVLGRQTAAEDHAVEINKISEQLAAQRIPSKSAREGR